MAENQRLEEFLSQLMTDEARDKLTTQAVEAGIVDDPKYVLRAIEYHERHKEQYKAAELCSKLNEIEQGLEAEELYLAAMRDGEKSGEWIAMAHIAGNRHDDKHENLYARINQYLNSQKGPAQFF